jgi:hypothetical protein
MIAVVIEYQTRRKGKDGAPSVMVGDVAEADRADEQPGEQGEHEGADAGHAKRAQNVEQAQRVGREVGRPVQARRDIGGEEQVVQLEAAAERDQRHQVPDVAVIGSRSSRAASCAPVTVAPVPAVVVPPVVLLMACPCRSVPHGWNRPRRTREGATL